MKKNNYPLKINKGKSFFLKGSISFMVNPLLNETDQLKRKSLSIKYWVIKYCKESKI